MVRTCDAEVYEFSRSCSFEMPCLHASGIGLGILCVPESTIKMRRDVIGSACNNN